MKSFRISRFLKFAAVCVLLAAAGCGEESKETASPQVEAGQQAVAETESVEAEQSEATDGAEAVAEGVAEGVEAEESDSVSEEARAEEMSQTHEEAVESAEAAEEKAKAEQAAESVEEEQVESVSVEESTESTEAAEAEKSVEDSNEPEQAEEKAETVAIMLKFAEGETGTYKVMTETDKSVTWEGPAESKPAAFTGGHTGNKVEMTFDQKIESVNENGNAVALITIKELNYLGRVKDSVALKYDSTDEKDRGKPLGMLVGESYKIELSPSGQFVRVVDATKARSAVMDSTARAILSDDAIKERHSIAALDTGQTKEFSESETWSNLSTFAFGMMGTKVYERTYTLQEINEADGEKTAVAKMTAVPSTAGAEEAHKDAAVNMFSKMFDNKETYEGELKFNATDGDVLKYSENLKSEWMAVDPAAPMDKQPDALKMTAVRAYQIEKLK